MEKTLYLDDEAATVALGERLGDACKPAMKGGDGYCGASHSGVVIFLEGDLGAGKTTMTRGVLRSFGHQGAVKSPTYTLVEPYDLAQGQLYHFDLYRLGDPEELEYMGIRDYFDAGNLCLIEWPKRGEGCLPPADVVLKLTVAAPGRTASLLAQTDLGRSVLAQL